MDPANATTASYDYSDDADYGVYPSSPTSYGQPYIVGEDDYGEPIYSNSLEGQEIIRQQQLQQRSPPLILNSPLIQQQLQQQQQQQGQKVIEQEYEEEEEIIEETEEIIEEVVEVVDEQGAADGGKNPPASLPQPAITITSSGGSTSSSSSSGATPPPVRTSWVAATSHGASAGGESTARVRSGQGFMVQQRGRRPERSEDESSDTDEAGRSRSRSSSREALGRLLAPVEGYDMPSSRPAGGAGGAGKTDSSLPLGRFEKTPENLVYNETERRTMQDIIGILATKVPEAFKIMFDCVHKEDTLTLINAIINLSFFRSVTLTILHHFIENEFKEHQGADTTVINTLFRENSVASKLAKQYLQKVGGDFLKEILGHLIYEVCVKDANVSYEIDPGRGVSPEEIEENKARLIARLDQLLTCVTSHNMVGKMPPGIRIIAAYFDELSRQYIPEVKADALIGGFIMLRYINPAIAAPEGAGLLPSGSKPPNQKVRRNLLLLSKVLQNMSNGLLFSAKETYLTIVNPWLELNMPRLQRVFHEIVTAASTSSRNLIVDNEAKVSVADFHVFHQILGACSDKIFAQVTDPGVKKELEKLLDTLGSYSRKISFANVMDSQQQQHVRAALSKLQEELGYVCALDVEGRKGAATRCVFVVGKYNIFLFKGRGTMVTGMAMDRIHLLDLKEIRLSGSNEITFVSSSLTISGTTENREELIRCIKRQYLSAFSQFPQSEMFSITAVAPAEVPLDDDVSIYHIPSTPCGNLSRTYEALCSYYNANFNSSFSYDINRLYANDRTFSLGKLFPDEIPDADLVPVFHALRYNTHFKVLANQGFRIRSPQVVSNLATLLRENRTLTALELISCGLPEKHLPSLFDSMKANPLCSIRSLTLVSIELDEKAAAALALFIASRNPSNGIESLVLDKSLHSSKACAALFSYANPQNPACASSLKELSLREAKLGDSIVQLSSWLTAAGQGLQKLCLGGIAAMGQRINGLLLSLVKSSPNLEVLDLSDIKFSVAEVTALAPIFLLSPHLHSLDVSRSLPSISSLTVLLPIGKPGVEITLTAAQNTFNPDIPSLKLLHETIPKMSNVVCLDLSETDLGDEGLFALFEGLTMNTNLHELLVNYCFRADNKRPRSDVVRALCKLINSDCPLERLEIAGGPKQIHQLGKSITPFFQALTNNQRLLSLNVTGHAFGPSGALSLVRLLESNHTLTRVVYDQNDIDTYSLEAISEAVKKNKSLISFPLPIMDIASMISSDKSSDGIKKIRQLCMEIEKAVFTSAARP